MTSLLILAAILFLAWLWAIWKRDTSAQFAAGWSYVLIVTSVICVVMAVGLKLR
jgi:hypothetical protein